MLNTNNRKIGDRVETLKFISRCEATKRSTGVCLEAGKWRERKREREREKEGEREREAVEFLSSMHQHAHLESEDPRAACNDVCVHKIHFKSEPIS